MLFVLSRDGDCSAIFKHAYPEWIFRFPTRFGSLISMKKISLKRISFLPWYMAGAILLAPVVSARAAEADLSVSLGAEYTTGSYGTSTDTNIWYFPVMMKYQTAADSLALTVPYVSLDGNGSVVAGDRAMRRTVPTSSGRQTNSGLGDIVLAGSHKLFETDSSRMDLTGKIKFGTANEKDNLGTGEDDVSVQLDMEKYLDSNSVYGTVGYKILGDPPGINFKNVLYGSLGLAHKLDAADTAGIEWYAQEATISGGPAASELTLYLSNKVDKKTKVTGYLLKGFSDGSPDWGFGVVLKLTQ